MNSIKDAFVSKCPDHRSQFICSVSFRKQIHFKFFFHFHRYLNICDFQIVFLKTEPLQKTVGCTLFKERICFWGSIFPCQRRPRIAKEVKVFISCLPGKGTHSLYIDLVYGHFLTYPLKIVIDTCIYPRRFGIWNWKTTDIIRNLKQAAQIHLLNSVTFRF